MAISKSLQDLREMARARTEEIEDAGASIGHHLSDAAHAAAERALNRHAGRAPGESGRSRSAGPDLAPSARGRFRRHRRRLRARGAHAAAAIGDARIDALPCSDNATATQSGTSGVQSA